MNIKLLTFSNTPNYGALLQTYALCEVLKSLGHSVELLKVNLQKISILNFFRLYLYDRFMLCFQKRYLPAFCEVSDIDPEALYIVGSDQVWNPHFIQSHKYMFFFDFLPDKVKRISYAASFGEATLNISQNDREHIKLLLDKFHKVSVRESFAVELCRKEFDILPEFVLDPTLLLSDYSKISGSVIEKNTLVSFKFVQNASYYDLLGYLSKELNVGVNRIDNRYIKLGKKEYVSKHVCVGKWLKSIAESKLVITDSFHALSFALTFRRQFIVLPSAKSRMGRIVSLLKLLGLEDRYYTSIEEVYLRLDWKNRIDYEEVDIILNKERIKSIYYLKRSVLK